VIINMSESEKIETITDWNKIKVVVERTFKDILEEYLQSREVFTERILRITNQYKPMIDQITSVQLEMLDQETQDRLKVYHPELWTK
jgi:hypothetical protein